jgi:prophage regulatory protein
VARAPTDVRIIREPELYTLTGLRQTQRRVLERGGDFPAKVRLGPRTVGWRSDEVDSWIASRSAARDQNGK